MLLRLLILLTVVPLVELTLLLRIGSRIGWAPTIELVILTGAVGAILARREGVKTIARIQRELDRGAIPTTAMADGVLILAAGLLLVTPGILTDFVGFALLIAPARSWIRKRLTAMWRDRIVVMHGSRDENSEAFVDVEGESVAADGPSGEDDTASPGAEARRSIGNGEAGHGS